MLITRFKSLKSYWLGRSYRCLYFRVLEDKIWCLFIIFPQKCTPNSSLNLPVVIVVNTNHVGKNSCSTWQLVYIGMMPSSCRHLFIWILHAIPGLVSLCSCTLYSPYVYSKVWHFERLSCAFIPRRRLIRKHRATLYNIAYSMELPMKSSEKCCTSWFLQAI